MSADDKKLVKSSLPAMKKEEIAAKKLKTEPKDEVDLAQESELEEKIKKQYKKLFKHKDNLKENLKKAELISILELNGSFIPVGTSEILDRVADFMAFGALTKCPKCKAGNFVYTNNIYECNGE